MKKLNMMMLVIVCVISLITTHVFAAIDLTNSSNPNIYSGITSVADGSVWKVLTQSPTGTGNYNPFLSFSTSQGASAGAGIEVGLNTDVTAQVYNDAKQANNYTRAVRWSELATVSVGNNVFYSFTFDLDEALNSRDKYFSIDVLRLYSGSSNLATSIAGLTQQWALSGGPILMDQSLSSSGNGRDDVQVLIPYFVPSAEWMYLYVEAGNTGLVDGRDFGAMNGFEEVRALMGPTTVPEPSTLLLLGAAILGLAGVRRFRK